MKRYARLWEQVIGFEALLHAAEEARRGKRFRPAVAAFHFDQERALWELHEELAGLAQAGPLADSAFGRLGIATQDAGGRLGRGAQPPHGGRRCGPGDRARTCGADTRAGASIHQRRHGGIRPG